MREINPLNNPIDWKWALAKDNRVRIRPRRCLSRCWSFMYANDAMRHSSGKKETAVQQIYRCVWCFLLLTSQGCDLLNLLPFSGRHGLAGWLRVRPASLCHVYFQSLARLVSQSDKRQTSCPQWRGMYRCVTVCVCVSACVLLGRESGRMLEDRYLWHFFQSSPVWTPPPSLTNREVCSWHSITLAHNSVSLGQLAQPMGGSSQGKTEVEREAELFTFSFCSSTQAHCIRGVRRDEEPDHREE